MNRVPKHKVFISSHEEDETYRANFVDGMKGRIIDKSVQVGDIDDRNTKTQTIRQKIRDDYIREATVTIVLIGPCTWQRKHIDWEIGSSLRQTKKNSRCGLLGILLPNHPSYEAESQNPRLLPPRLADNNKGADPYARIYSWPKPWAPAKVASWIHQAYARRNGMPPNNHRKPFQRNRTADYSAGWKN